MLPPMRNVPTIFHLVSCSSILMVISSPTFKSGRALSRWLPMTMAFWSSGISQRPEVMVGSIRFEICRRGSDLQLDRAFSVQAGQVAQRAAPGFDAFHARHAHRQRDDLIRAVQAVEPNVDIREARSPGSHRW